MTNRDISINWHFGPMLDDPRGGFVHAAKRMGALFERKLPSYEAVEGPVDWYMRSDGNSVFLHFDGRVLPLPAGGGIGHVVVPWPVSELALGLLAVRCMKSVGRPDVTVDGVRTTVMDGPLFDGLGFYYEAFPRPDS